MVIVAARAQPAAVPMALALSWAIAIAVFATIERLWGPEDEQGIWGEVAEPALGNFVVVFVAAFAVSAIHRIVRSRSSWTEVSR